MHQKLQLENYIINNFFIEKSLVICMLKNFWKKVLKKNFES